MKWTTGNAARIGGMAFLLLALVVMSNFTAFAHGYPDHKDQIVVYLKHTPYGQATLKWNPDNEKLAVTISMAGLQPKTRHPAHIHAGDCSVNGKIIYPLSDVVADIAGNAVATTTINGVENGIPASGWFINVHSGPTLSTPAEALAISCGNVSNPHKANSVSTTLDGSTAPNQMAFGVAHISLHNQTLTVNVVERNLAPGSSHAIHIHAGSCQHQVPGTVVYPLTTLKANSHGVATSTTTINDVKVIPENGWYINVHFSTDLSTQAGYDPIDCGNVTV
jgi:hypothetical protein